MPAKNNRSLKHRYLGLLISKYGEICWYCGISLKDRHKHIDHIIAKRLGGRDDLENLALSCKFCNFAKWYSYLDEFYDWLIYVHSSNFKPKIKINDEFHPTSTFHQHEEEPES